MMMMMMMRARQIWLCNLVTPIHTFSRHPYRTQYPHVLPLSDSLNSQTNRGNEKKIVISLSSHLMVMMISDEKFPQFYKICHKHQDDSANMKKKRR
jgi:hypothetical protein